MRSLFPTRVMYVSASIMFLGVGAVSPQPARAQMVACEPPTVVNAAPPPLPVYEQPPVPGPGYIWTPGYWAWDSDEDDYYWVPGTWVEPPRPGLLWTPGYWAWVAGAYVFHRGYWGEHVGFYGGIDYGHGYMGDGFEGGRWRNGTFFYNRSVTNITRTNITNIYEQPLPMRAAVNRSSFNGGTGGIQVRPTPQQRAFSREVHFAPTPMQHRNVVAASKDPTLSIKHNHGKPPVAATPHPAMFKGTGVVPAHEANRPVEPLPGARPGVKPATGTQTPGINGPLGAQKPPVANEKLPIGGKVEGHGPAPQGKAPIHPAMPEGKPLMQKPGNMGKPGQLPHPVGVAPHPMATHPAGHPVQAPHPGVAPHPMAAHPAAHPMQMPHPGVAPHPIAPHPMARPVAPHPVPVAHPVPHPHPMPHPAPHHGPEKKPGEK